MSAESTGLGAIELEPLVSLPPVPEGPEPPVPEGPEGIAEFWINMAREEILAIKEEHKNSSERKDAIIDVLRKELEAVRASALHWQTMYTSKAPKELEELKKLYGGPPMRIIEMGIEDAIQTVEKDPAFAEREQLEQIPPLADLEALGDGLEALGDDSDNIGGDSGREA